MKILIKSSLTEAQENGIINRNPARKLTVPDKPEKQRESYTADEVKIIIEHLKQYKNQTIATATATLLLTGIRRGEMLGLMWTDINEDIIHIRRGVYLKGNTPTIEEYRAKTKGSIRQLPLPKLLQEQIANIPKTSDFIFSSKNGNLIEPHNFNKYYYRMMKSITEAEQNFRILSPHCLRHTYATLTLTADPNLRNVQTLLRHSDPKTTARYTHPDMTELKKSSLQFMAILQDN